MSGNLSVENVTHVFAECLVRDDEFGVEFVVAECATAVGFHPGLLRDHEDVIRGMLGELNERLRAPNGAGFFDASETWDGVRWVGEAGREDAVIEMLVLLGRAIGAVEYIIPLKDCDDFPDFRVVL